MHPSVAVLSGLVTLALAALAAWHFDMSFTRAAILAPVIVVCVGAAVAVLLLWTRVVLESVRGRRQRS